MADSARSNRSGMAIISPRSALASPRTGAESKLGGRRDSTDQRKREFLTERTVIDEDLIRNVVREELLTLQDPSCVPAARDVDLTEVTTLVLSFQNIYQIDNLLGFERLVKLQLDNNIIEKIENLDHLVNLEWLDLSFNNIRKIEGLEKLVKLTDLSLYNNQIERIEGLENLSHLNVLSLGRNKIRDLEDIKDLRRFKNLRCLNLKENPVCEDDRYRNTVLAFVSTLKYLDYQTVEQSQVSKAQDAYQEQLFELKEKDKIIDAELRTEKKEQEKRSLLAEANLDGLTTLFQDILLDDTEQSRLKMLPGFNRILQDYRAMFEKAANELKDDMLATHQQKQDEIKLFETMRTKITSGHERKSVEKIQAFEARKKRELKRWQQSVLSNAPDKAILLGLDEEINTLYDTLMDYEALQVEQMDSILDEFKEGYTKYVGENVLKIAVTSKTLQDIAGNYLKTVIELIRTLHDRFSKEEPPAPEEPSPLDPSLPSPGPGPAPSASAEVIKMILTDKDGLLQSIATSHENHISKIIAKDDEIRERETGRSARLIAEARKAEYTRNRNRVTEIFDLTQRYHKMILDEVTHFQEDEDD